LDSSSLDLKCFVACGYFPSKRHWVSWDVSKTVEVHWNLHVFAAVFDPKEMVRKGIGYNSHKHVGMPKNSDFQTYYLSKLSTGLESLLEGTSAIFQDYRITRLQQYK
jgi:hypothetical protein